MSIRRGDVVWCRFDSAQGSEQSGTRPAVVVQNDVGNRYSPNTIVAALTTKIGNRAFPFIVRLPEDTLPRPSAVDCAQLRTVEKARLGERIARLDTETMRSVDDALRASLGLY